MTDSFFKNDTEPEELQPEVPELKPLQQKTDSATGSFSTQEGRMAAILSYIPFLCFIPLLNMKDNKEARFHARQGVLLFLIEMVAVIFLIDGISDFIFKGILLVAIALSAVGIYFAVQGKNYKLPVIGDLADKSKL
jgi:uncharacterized membrane protein